MADFVTTTTNKTAVRDLATPIGNLAAFSALIESVTDDNPWECTEYTASGVTVDGVTKAREYYTGRVVYTDPATGKVIGNISVKAPTPSGFTGSVASVLADADIATDMGGIASHDSSTDRFSCSLKCHDENGEIYYVTFARDRIRVTSYEDAAILSTIETWADTLPALA
ncbi:MAG: hypothetical protein JXA44_07905 [Methanospirillaceae archaeon]|nr:hypothetical protein [Methanospirillaceae archaeon]